MTDIQQGNQWRTTGTAEPRWDVAPRTPEPPERNLDAGWGWIIGFSTLAICLRLLPYYVRVPNEVNTLWNFAAVGALGLFAGTRLRSHAAFLVPLVVMFVSDLLLIPALAQRGMPSFTWMSPIVYGCYLLNVLLGRAVRNTSAPMIWAGPAALLGALLFFLVTNYAVWAGGEGNLYAPTWDGLMQCYLAALPFCRSTFISDVGYTILFFGVHALGVLVVSRQKVSQPA
jgi:hypothetical protein